MTDRTTVVIAHRLSTVREASRIILLDQGTIVEEGSHESLLRMNGLYAELYNLLFRGSENEADDTVAVASLLPS